MKLTLDHPQAKRGRPVFVHGRRVINYRTALILIRHRLKLTAAEFAALLGVSRRTVNGWDQGRPPAATCLYALKHKLNDDLTALRR
jgi:DNA-binding XRE family transcriptional regulator